MGDLFDLSGKTALITGGSRGLGRQMGLVFADAGANVAVVSRKLDSCEKTAAEIEAKGRKAFAYSCHAGKWDDLEPMVDAVEENLGKIDILVNNAGLSPVAGSSAQTSEELFDKVIAVNLKGPFRLTAIVGPRMKKRGAGSVINISSIAAIRPDPITAPYGAAKSGLVVLTRAHAKEYGPQVRVNCIMAGPFHTDISKAWSRTEAFAQEAKRSIALQRAGEPEEIMGIALYLASDASSFTTGSVIRVDGGSA